MATTFGVSVSGSSWSRVPVIHAMKKQVSVIQGGVRGIAHLGLPLSARG